MKGLPQKIASLGSFLAEMVVYAGFVSAYFFLILHFLGYWVKHVFDENKALYAILALALILVQGVLLQMLTTALLKLIQRKMR